MSSSKSSIHKAFNLDVGFHGDLTGTNFDPNVNLEVISLGLSRTGTTSLQLALTKLGFGPSHQGVDLFRSVPRTKAFMRVSQNLIARTWKAGDPALTARLHTLMSGYRSSTDVPINTIPEEIYAAYPKAKYILTTRPDGAEGWWTSIQSAASWHSRRDIWRYVFRFLIYPVQFLRVTDDKVQLFIALWTRQYGSYDASMYDKHHQHIKTLIPQDQLLVYDVREGWEPLCKFLEVPVPKDEEYPRLNEAAAMHKIYFGMMAYGAVVWGLYAGGVCAAGWAVMNPDTVRSWWDVVMETASSIIRGKA